VRDGQPLFVGAREFAREERRRAPALNYGDLLFAALALLRSLAGSKPHVTSFPFARMPRCARAGPMTILGIDLSQRS